MKRWFSGDRFSGLARFEDGEDGVHAQLLEPLTYITADRQWAITVPDGFETDFASIPRPLWSLIPPRGRYNRPAFVHDYLYQTAPIDPRTGERCTWAAADAIMFEACANVDTRWTQRAAIWLGLRLGGWLAWRRYRRGELVAR